MNKSDADSGISHLLKKKKKSLEFIFSPQHMLRNITWCSTGGKRDLNVFAM